MNYFFFATKWEIKLIMMQLCKFRVIQTAAIMKKQKQKKMDNKIVKLIRESNYSRDSESLIWWYKMIRPQSFIKFWSNPYYLFFFSFGTTYLSWCSYIVCWWSFFSCSDDYLMCTFLVLHLVCHQCMNHLVFYCSVLHYFLELIVGKWKLQLRGQKTEQEDS